jgi:hypothetical protein
MKKSLIGLISAIILLLIMFVAAIISIIIANIPYCAFFIIILFVVCTGYFIGNTIYDSLCIDKKNKNNKKIFKRLKNIHKGEDVKRKIK